MIDMDLCLRVAAAAVVAVGWPWGLYGLLILAEKKLVGWLK